MCHIVLPPFQSKKKCALPTVDGWLAIWGGKTMAELSKFLCGASLWDLGFKCKKVRQVVPFLSCGYVASFCLCSSLLFFIIGGSCSARVPYENSVIYFLPTKVRESWWNPWRGMISPGHCSSLKLCPPWRNNMFLSEARSLFSTVCSKLLC
jgi:hypothetical protein